MSALIRPSTIGAIIEIGAGQNDDSVQPVDYRVSLPQRQGIGNDLRYTDVLWPRCSFPVENGVENGFNGLDCAHQYWEWNFPPTGFRRRKQITGLVVDATGAVVSGATVNLYSTSTGALLDSTTSGTDGSYALADPNNASCFVVAYNTGSPDTTGATLNTLTGS